MTGRIKLHVVNMRNINQTRCGATIIECGCVLIILLIVITVALFFTAQIVNNVLPEGLFPQHAKLLRFTILISIFLYWGLVAFCIPRLRIRYRSLLVFPVMIGFPLGLTCVPILHTVLPFMLACVVISTITVTILVFCVQYIFLIYMRFMLRDAHFPLPDVFPPARFTNFERCKPKNLDSPSRHPNDTREWRVYHNEVSILRQRALESLILDKDMEAWLYQFTMHCRKQLQWDCEHDTAATIGESLTVEKIICPFTVCDFSGAKEWAEYALDRLNQWPFAFPKRDVLIISAICELILKDTERFECFSQQLTHPVDFFSRITSREPKYQEILVLGLAQNDLELCRQAIRLQSETWYRPTLFGVMTWHINLEGVAMTNLCRWHGIAIPPIEPIIPEELIYSMTSE